MVIKQLCLDRFGKFHGESFDLDAGMNVIYGGNESGKSTIRDFVMFMLFGMNADPDAGSYRRYRSNDTGSCEGRLHFEHEGKLYFMYRISGDSGEQFSIRDDETGVECVGNGGNIGDLIPGLTPGRMGNTISISRPDDPTDTDEYRDLAARRRQIDREIATIENRMNESADSDYEERKKAVELIKQNNEIARQYNEKKKRLKALQSSPDQHVAKEPYGAWEKYENKRTQLEDNRFTQEELRDAAEGSGFKALAFTIPLVVAAALLWFLGASLITNRNVRAGVSLGIVVLALIVFLFVIASGSGKRRRAKKLEKKARAIEADMRKILQSAGVRSREELRQIHYSGRVSSDRQSSEEKALRHDLSVLRSRYNDLQIPLRPYLQKYGNSISLEKQEDPAAAARLQELRRKSASIAARMDNLENAEGNVAVLSVPIPLILDGFFAAYDDNRLKRTLIWLTKQMNFSQAVILTCHHREAQTLDKLHIPYTYRELEE